MPTRIFLSAALILTGFFGVVPASAQGRQDPDALLASQRAAMVNLAFMDGVWRGEAWTMTRTGEKYSLTQTERIGSFLGGAVKVIEGRGYETDGKVAFNALGVISYDPGSGGYSMQSHAMGHSGSFKLTPTADGFIWEIPAGPMTIRYTAVIKDGAWRQVGERIVPGQEPVRILEMNLKRLGDTDWPAAGAVSAK